MTKNSYRDAQRSCAVAWKAHTEALPESARPAAPYVGQRFTSPSALPFCLPVELARYNLLPEVRDSVLALFAELQIPWHDGHAGNPSNHLLDSQVQCANALGQMVSDPGRIVAAFGRSLDIAEVLPIEPGRLLTFEFIGNTDYFGEGHGRPRTRGAYATSVDAAFRYRTTHGCEELALVEWKYTEEYTTRRRGGSDATRLRSYGAEFTDGPLRSDLASFDAMLEEPFYQLMRQQLLAHCIESDPADPAERVRVLHVLSLANEDYQHSVRSPVHKALGGTVSEVWQRLLRTPDRFIHLDPEIFLDEKITSSDYIERYAADLVWDEAGLCGYFECDLGDFDSVLIDFEGDVILKDYEVELIFQGDGTVLPYPLRISDLFDVAAELELDLEVQLANEVEA